MHVRLSLLISYMYITQSDAIEKNLSELPGHKSQAQGTKVQYYTSSPSPPFPSLSTNFPRQATQDSWNHWKISLII